MLSICRLFSIALLALLVGLTACGERLPKGAAQKSVVVKATARRTLPGRREQAPTTNYTFTVSWKEALKPEAWRFRIDTTWYEARWEAGQGDTLIVYTTRRNRSQEAKPKGPEKELYYSDQNNIWVPLDVPAIEKLPDVIMP
jgi:hypothetical protein